VPVVSVASKYVQWILLGGVLLIKTFPQLLLIGILLFAATTVFTVITLPVEFDASRRALAWLDTKGIVRKEEYPMTKDALKWAASTYVVAAIASIATLLYYLQIYMGRRD
jgi:Zn-dependent membrane protease YugP